MTYLAISLVLRSWPGIGLSSIVDVLLKQENLKCTEQPIHVECLGCKKYPTLQADSSKLFLYL
jgi:hypothetical protein